MTKAQIEFLDKIILEVGEEMDFYIDSELGVAKEDIPIMEILSHVYNFATQKKGDLK